MTPPPARAKTPADVQYAVGAGVTLLAAVLTSLILALVLSQMVGRVYVSFVMPILTGWIIGAVIGLTARYFRVRDATPIILSAILGALIAFGGYQLLAYLKVLDMIAESAGFLSQGGADGAAMVMDVMEEQTGESGFFAYLAFVSKGPYVPLSPLGLVARMELGLVGTVAGMAVELVLAIGAAIMVGRIRSRVPPLPPLEPPADPPAPTPSDG